MFNRAGESVSLVTAIILLALSLTEAQTTGLDRPAFTAASVRPVSSEPGDLMMFSARGGRFTSSAMPLSMLIAWAYDVRTPDLRGAPGWIESERYTILGTAERDAPTSEVRLMLQILLEERFKLRVREEPTVVSAWALVLDRSDGRLGPGLRAFTGTCEAATRQEGPEFERSASQESTTASCGVQGGLGRVSGTGGTVGSIAPFLAAALSTPVFDRTGLTGRYDIELRWNPLPAVVSAPSIDPLPSIFTALREQLGLRLRSEKTEGRSIVIEHLERPTPD